MSFIKVTSKKDYIIAELSRGKANPINTDLVIEIRKLIANVQSDDSIRGIVWTGNTDGYFSVGLDLKELFVYDATQISNFWKQWDTMLVELTSFTKPMVTAVNGYSPAGGCILAMTSDFRVMADDAKYLIGLNELAVGIAVPENIYLLYGFWLGKRNAYQALMKAKLFSPQEALSVGLVDDVRPMGEVLSCAEEHLQQMLSATDAMLAASKHNMRRVLVADLKAIPDVPDSVKLESWFAPANRVIMQAVVERLSK